MSVIPPVLCISLSLGASTIGLFEALEQGLSFNPVVSIIVT
jgi:hypothetical protein